MESCRRIKDRRGEMETSRGWRRESAGMPALPGKASWEARGAQYLHRQAGQFPAGCRNGQTGKPFWTAPRPSNHDASRATTPAQAGRWATAHSSNVSKHSWTASFALANRAGGQDSRNCKSRYCVSGIARLCPAGPAPAGPMTGQLPPPPPAARPGNPAAQKRRWGGGLTAGLAGGQLGCSATGVVHSPAPGPGAETQRAARRAAAAPGNGMQHDEPQGRSHRP